MIQAHLRPTEEVRSGSRNLSRRSSPYNDGLTPNESGRHQTHGSVKCPVSSRFRLSPEKINDCYLIPSESITRNVLIRVNRS